jgi:hypothetical protein
VDEREERIGRNEALFRDLNERVKDVDARFGYPVDGEFLCECGNRECVERVTVPLEEYERVRSDSTTFIVKNGHEQADVESIVAEHDDHVVVQKRAGTPARVATETDPRS